MNNHAHAPHKLLEFAITRAAITGKEKTVQTIIPFNELMAGIGKPAKNSDYDLQVTIELKWVPVHPLLEPDTDFDDSGEPI